MHRLIACILSLSLLLLSPYALAEEGFPLSPDPEDTALTEVVSEEEMPEEVPEEETEEEKPGSSLCEKPGDLLETEEHISYISGYENGTFRPAGQITRAETAKLFYSLLREKPELTAGFSDVPESAWYYTPVCALASLGVLNGYPDETFRPGRGITRAEFVTIASKFSTLLPGDVQFSDVEKGHWARKAIASCAAYGWVNGYQDGTFRPDAKITRAEAVKILNAILGRSADPSVVRLYYAKEFPDVSRSYWAYGEICEAATTHEYTAKGRGEVWICPDNYDGTGWVYEEGLTAYEDPETGEKLTGFQPIGDYTYYFDPETGALQTGWKVIDGKHYLLPARNQSAGALQINELLSLTNYNRANRGFDGVKYITVHYTAEPGDTARGECQSFYSVYQAASAHFFVDGTSIWRCVLDRDISWHCGSSTYYHDFCRNTNSIGIEMCCRKSSTYTLSAYDDDWYFASGTVDNTAALVRQLMMQYGIPLENVVRHNDVSHKVCPAPYVNSFSAWQSFLKRVDQGKTDYQGSYTARITADSVTVHSGPGAGYSIVKTLSKDTLVTVLEERGKDVISGGRWAKTPEGWVHYAYISRT